jgi:hypothetical protein
MDLAVWVPLQNVEANMAGNDKLRKLGAMQEIDKKEAERAAKFEEYAQRQTQRGVQSLNDLRKSDAHDAPVDSAGNVDRSLVVYRDVYDPKVPYLPGETSAPADFSWKMKIMVAFLQIMSNLAVGMQIPWPQSFLNLCRSINFINIDFMQVSSSDCIFPTNFYNGTLAACIIPPVLILLLVIFYTLPKYLWHRNDRDALKRTRIKSWRVVLFFLWLIYPTVSSRVLQIFVCVDVNGVPYLQSDMRLVCYDAQWNFYAFLSFLFIFVYPIGIPLLFYIRLYRHRGVKLERYGVRAEMGMLYDAFSRERWWFEMVEMLHKLALTSILAFLPTAYQLPTGLVIANLFLMTLLLMRPYVRKGDERLHLLVQTEISLMLYVGYIYSKGDQSFEASLKDMPFSLTSKSTSFDYILTIVLITVVGWLFVTFAVQFYKYVLIKLRARYEADFKDRRARGEVSEAEMEQMRLDATKGKRKWWMSKKSELKREFKEPFYFEKDQKWWNFVGEARAHPFEGYKMTTNPLYGKKKGERWDEEDEQKADAKVRKQAARSLVAANPELLRLLSTSAITWPPTLTELRHDATAAAAMQFDGDRAYLAAMAAQVPPRCVAVFLTLFFGHC